MYIPANVPQSSDVLVSAKWFTRRRQTNFQYICCTSRWSNFCSCYNLFTSHSTFSRFSQALAGECGFMAANLYARSIFGEDALANVSIEKPSDQSGPSVTGHVRIRAKSQVMMIFVIIIH